MKPFPRTYEMDWRNVLQLLSWKSHNRNNNAIVDYNSPALCTPVTLPPIGDAAYRQHAGGGLNHEHRQHEQTSGQSNLTYNRIAAADGLFRRIRQVVPICPHGRAHHWRHLANTIELVLPLAHPSFVRYSSKQYTRSSPNFIQIRSPPAKL